MSSAKLTDDLGSEPKKESNRDLHRGVEGAVKVNRATRRADLPAARNTLVNEGPNTSWTSLAAFIQAIATPLVPGDTYMGNNGTDTFIFTDTANGQTGAVEIANVFSGANSTISNNVLTLKT